MDLRPTPGLTLATLIVVAGCTALGVWQLNRADEKTALAELLGQRTDAPPQPIESIDFSDPSAIRYTNVEVTGRFDYTRQFHVPHRRLEGRTGSHVITPFVVASSGRPLLVNRGWVPASTTGNPEPPTTPDEGRVTLSGRLVAPGRPPLRLGPANSDPMPWQRPWLFADPELFSEKTGAPTYPLILLADAARPGGPRPGWTLPQPDPSMHLGYAVQWFAFAVIAVVVWAVLSRKVRRGDHER